MEPNHGLSDNHKPNRFTRIERKRKMPAHHGDSVPSVGGCFLLFSGKLDSNNIKGAPTTPWCCPMPLVTDFIVVRQPTGPCVLHLFRVLSLLANRQVLTPCIRTDLRCQSTSRMSSAFLLIVYTTQAKNAIFIYK